MLNSKKSFLLLLLIPFFAFSLYASSLLFETALLWCDIIFFTAFIISVIALFALNKKVLSFLVAVIVQAVIAVCAVAGLIKGDSVLQRYAVYATMYLPVLPLIAAVVNIRPGVAASAAKTSKKATSGMSNTLATVLFLLLQLNLIATIVVTEVHISKQLHTPNGKIDYIVLCFCALIFILTGITAFKLKKRRMEKAAIVLLVILCVVGLLEQIAYLSWFITLNLTLSQVIFPLCTATVILLENGSQEK
ncbi:MAG: hypothetical protein IKE65_05350 [Clostridia bacterium]|nr:hypothetical protein [Clostridia bacterium]